MFIKEDTLGNMLAQFNKVDINDRKYLFNLDVLFDTIPCVDYMYKLKTEFHKNLIWLHGTISACKIKYNGIDYLILASLGGSVFSDNNRRFYCFKRTSRGYECYTPSTDLNSPYNFLYVLVFALSHVNKKLVMVRKEK